MRYLFIFNEGKPNEFVLDDEPIGWVEIEIEFDRSKEYHGIFYDYSIKSLQFIGEAFSYLVDEYELNGVDGYTELSVKIICNDTGKYEDFYKCNLDYATYKRVCDDYCYVEMEIMPAGCLMQFINNKEVKVTIDDTKALDKVTDLEPYNALGFEMDMPGKTLILKTDYQEDLDSIQEVCSSFFYAGFFPARINPLDPPCESFYKELYLKYVPNKILLDEIEVINGADFATDDINDINEPIVTFKTAGAATVEFRIKGKLFGAGNIHDLTLCEWIGSGIEAMAGKFFFKDENGNVTQLWNDAGAAFDSIFNPNGTYDLRYGLDLNNPCPSVNINTHTPFDVDIWYTYTANFNVGDTLNFWFSNKLATNVDLEITDSDFTALLKFIPDVESYFKITQLSQFPTTKTKAYAINEVMSRIAESYTNDCMRLKSELFGRLDSQPYANTTNEYGAGLTVLTKGLQLREKPNEKLIASWKDIMEGLNPIWNIGFGMEADIDRDGNHNRIRVEKTEYFYKDEEIFFAENPDKVTFEIDNELIFKTINLGYAKYEAEEYNGLDEFLSSRQFRTSINNINSKKELLSKFIASGYTIEITRRKAHISSGEKDWRYDNDLFYISCYRNGANSLVVEQGDITSPSNIIDPPTAYNFRISPIRNLMRWFKILATGYKDFSSIKSKLFFSDGVGNTNAAGKYAQSNLSTIEDLENGVIKEDQDISQNEFQNFEDVGKPIFEPMKMRFKYPVSYEQFKQIKANPYGYVRVLCCGEEYKGYIKPKLRYSIDEGMGDFELTLKRN